MALNSIEELIEDIRAGKMVILMDDEDRENEGDLIIASECVKAEHINFMARFARGLICMPMTRERCETLKLPLMAPRNGSGFGTKFTVSIEAAEGVTTGISAADRARTVQAAVARNAVAADIVSPGHIFPLMAQPGGVLARARALGAAFEQRGGIRQRGARALRHFVLEQLHQQVAHGIRALRFVACAPSLRLGLGGGQAGRMCLPQRRRQAGEYGGHQHGGHRHRTDHQGRFGQQRRRRTGPVPETAGDHAGGRDDPRASNGDRAACHPDAERGGTGAAREPDPPSPDRSPGGHHPWPSSHPDARLRPAVVGDRAVGTGGFHPHPGGARSAAMAVRAYNEAIFREIGIDNIITTIEQPMAEIARLAVEAAKAAHRQHPQPPQTTALPTI